MFKSYKICLEMLKQRKYIILEKEKDRILALRPLAERERESEKAAFSSREHLSTSVLGEKVVVFFTEVPKFNVKSIQICIAIMNKISIKHAIIIYKVGVTAFTKKTIENSIDITFELFSDKDLQYNITKHRLQPIFTRLTLLERENILEKYGSNFAIMRVDDPIARFFYYKKGDIIKINRKGAISYRIVN